MLDIFITPFFEYEFLRYSLLACFCLSFVGSLLGLFLHVKGLSLAADALSHSILPGAALAALWTGFSMIALVVGGISAGISLFFLSHWLHKKTSIREDSILSLNHLFSLALGLLIISYNKSPQDILHFLMGSGLTVTDAQLTFLVGMSVVILSLLLIFWRPLWISALDPEFATTVGIPVSRYHFFFLSLLATQLIISFQFFGTLLSMGLVLGPSLISRLLFKNRTSIIISAPLIGVVLSYIGLILSNSFNSPFGPTVLALMGGLFILIVLCREVTKKVFLSFIAGLVIFKSTPNEAATVSAEPIKIKVVSSFSIIASLVTEIGGDSIEHYTVAGRDQNLHGYQLKPMDQKKIEKADVVFMNGLNLEPWLISQANVVNLSDGVSTIVEQDRPDPHAWQDPKNVIIYLQNIEKTLSKFKPSQQSQYVARKNAYVEKVKKLDAEIKTTFAGLNHKSKKILTNHEAFTYFGHAYGIEFVAPVGLSSQSEPSAQKMRQIADQIKKLGITSYLVETGENSTFIKQLAKSSGLKKGGELFADYLPADHYAVKDYLSMMKHNAKVIVKALE